MGIGISTFTEIVGAGPSHTFDILGHQDVRQRRDPRPPDRLGDRPHRRADPGSGARDDLRPDRGRGARSAGRQHHRRARRHRHRALRSRHLRQPQHADGRRGDGDGRAQDPREGPRARRAPAGGQRGRPGVGRPQVPGQGRAGAVQDDAGDRLRRLHQPPAGDGGRVGGGQLLRPAEPDLPLRRLHLRGRHRPRHRRWSRSAASWRSTTAARSSTR